MSDIIHLGARKVHIVIFRMTRDSARVVRILAFFVDVLE